MPPTIPKVCYNTPPPTALAPVRPDAVRRQKPDCALTPLLEPFIMKASELVPTEVNENIPEFGAGDTVRVNFRIREGTRERVQAFQGVCIRRSHGKGPAANFTVRRITAGIGIERVFPLYSPLIESLEVTRQGKVRRAKLYYLRGRQGRAARIKERTNYRSNR